MPERIDRVGQHKTAFQKNKKIILATQDVCALCGAPVDKTLKRPDPMSASVDHIIPIAKGGHPSSLENLQLTHLWCNMHKGDKLFTTSPANNRSAKNNPHAPKDPAPEKDPGLKTTAPSKQPGGDLDGAGIRGEINNDDLPLHADWTSFAW